MAVTLGLSALSVMMPMHLVIDPQGRVLAAGETLARILPGVVGAGFFDLFLLRRPSGVADVAALLARAGERLQLTLRGREAGGEAGMDFRGLAVPATEGRALVNLSFGIGVVDAVRAHSLTEADFAATDLTVELLYLVEAKSAVMAELRRLNARLHGAKEVAEAQALTDALTGLGNRRALLAALTALAGQAGEGRGAPFALMHLDLDYFKQVNDSLGHAAGDHVLTEVARILTEETRAQDVVARIGGDEFVIVLPEMPAAPALQRVARRILQRLARPIPFDGAEARVAGSLGMVLSQSYARPDPDRMLSDADSALYAAKRAGRGRAVLFDPAVSPPFALG